MQNEREESERELLRFCLKRGIFSEKRVSQLLQNCPNLQTFKEWDFENTRPVDEDGSEIKLNDSQISRLQILQSSTYVENNIQTSWVKYLAHSWILTQYQNIEEKTLADLEMNPMMITALQLFEPRQLLEFFVGSLLYRSIFTSMGFFLEDLLSYGHEGVRPGHRGEWFDVIKQEGGITYPIQVKSGPSDIDADQMRKFNDNFNEKENETTKPLLGWTYGVRERGMAYDMATTYLDNWEERILVGKELWNYVSGDDSFLEHALEWVNQVAINIVRENPIHNEVENVVNRLLPEFVEKYGDGAEGVQTYIRESTT